MTTQTSSDARTGRTALRLPGLALAEVRKPAYAYVGVADLALEQVKDLPGRSVATAREVQARLAEVPTRVRTLPAQVEERLQRTTGRAGRAYTVLALRGERLVTSIRRQPATEAAVEEGKEAVRKVEAAADAARRSVRAGEQALKDAAEKLG